MPIAGNRSPATEYHAAGMARTFRTSRRGRVRRVARRLLVVVLLFGAVGVWGWWAIETDPGWWAPPSRIDAAVRDSGGRTEMFVLEQLHKIREPDATWRFRLRNDDINAWLAANLPAWLEHETGEPWPDGVSVPQVSAGLDGLHVGIQMQDRFGGRVLTLRVTPTIDAGGLHLSTDRVAIGRLSIPGFAADRVLTAVRSALGEQVEDEDITYFTDVLFGREAIDPIIELADGRTVEVVDVALEPDGVLFTCRTMPDGAERGVRRESATERTTPPG